MARLGTIKCLALCIFTLFGLTLCRASNDLNDSSPQQIHLSLGSSPVELVVTWTTYNPSDLTFVQFGQSATEFDRVLSGWQSVFVDGGELKRVHYIHRVVLTGLDALTTYYYRCGSNTSWSTVYSFKTLSNKPDWSPRVLLYGDLGLENGVSIPRIREQVERGNVDLVFHAGDFAYDMDSNNSHVGDQFMRTIEPIAARVPYQTCVGNHEYAYNFSNYVNRFTMYDMTSLKGFTGDRHFYAFHLGPALIISLSTEYYYFIQYGLAQILNQYFWLEAVLVEANLPENRAARPWIITVGHRPMYCTDNDGDDCTHQNSIIRKGMTPVHSQFCLTRHSESGIPLFHTWGLEDLFYKHGVDVEFWAHEHSYERLWPVYDTKVYNGSVSPYTDPAAPVHIITGSAGCQEKLDNFGPPKPWSAFRLSDYGYTRLNIHNATHLSIEQISDQQDGKMMDSITVVQHRHGPRSSSPTNKTN